MNFKSLILIINQTNEKLFWTIILFTCYTTVKQEKKETTRTDKKKIQHQAYNYFQSKQLLEVLITQITNMSLSFTKFLKVIFIKKIQYYINLILSKTIYSKIFSYLHTYSFNISCPCIFICKYKIEYKNFF